MAARQRGMALWLDVTIDGMIFERRTEMRQHCHGMYSY